MMGGRTSQEAAYMAQQRQNARPQYNMQVSLYCRIKLKRIMFSIVFLCVFDIFLSSPVKTILQPIHRHQT